MKVGQMGYPELCLGKIAGKPYYFSKMLVNVYSVEELCFCIRNEAYLIDSDIVDKELADWLGDECGLQDLSLDLMRIIKEKGSPAAFAGVILEYTGYQTREEIVSIESVIRDNSSKSPAERGRTKADFLYDNGKYATALYEYEKILKGLPENEVMIKSGIYYNMASAQMQLFDFNGAAENYRCSYECTGDQETLKMYLASLRMAMKDEDYVSFIAEHPDYCDTSLEAESLFGKWKEQFDTTDQSRMLFTLKVMREDGSDTSGEPGPYYSELDRLTEELKRRYREMVQTNAAIQKPAGEVSQET